MLRPITKIFKWTFVGILLLTAGFAIAIFIGSRWTTTPKLIACDENRHTVYVNAPGIGVHLEFVLSLDLLPEEHLAAIQLADTTRFLAYGWGDREFYLETPTWNDLDYGIAARSLLVNTEPAMHLMRYGTMTDTWTELSLCDRQLKQLLFFLENSFRKNDQQEWIAIPSDRYNSDHFFFESLGNYNGVNTCNSWLNNGLKAADVKTSVWSPLAFGVLRHL